MSLHGHDIVAFTYADWHASWSTPQQLMVRLARDNRVLYVDVPRSLLYGLKPRDPQGAGQWQGPACQEVAPNLHVYHPPHVFLPSGRLPAALGVAAIAANGRLLAALVQRQMRALAMHDVILWNFSPLHAGAVPHVPHRLRIYDVCDEWAQYITWSSGRAILARIESRLVREADLVFVGTENMRTARAALNDEVYVVHHGADYDHFARAADPALPEPDDLRALPRPRVGAIGVLDPQRFDVDLIDYLAAREPAWSFVVVGPARAGLDLGRIERRPNVYLTGNRALEALPDYLKGFDVALIPYRLNDATRNIYPLKLQEYLASGKPVVSTALPALLPYADVVGLADTHEAAHARLQEALAGKGVGDAAARQAVARANSWQARVAEKGALVHEALARTAENGRGRTQ